MLNSGSPPKANQDPALQTYWAPQKENSDLQAVLVHMSKAATVKVEHSNAAAHCQEVIAAVQSRKVDLERPESTLNLPERKAWTFSIIIIPIIIINIIVTAVKLNDKYNFSNKMLNMVEPGIKHSSTVKEKLDI